MRMERNTRVAGHGAQRVREVGDQLQLLNNLLEYEI